MRHVVRFGISGLVATATHVLVFAGLVELMTVPAVLASVMAFGTALLVSYGLNYHWTFEALGAHRVMLPRFAAVATAGLAVNVLITYLVVNVGGYWYGHAVALVVISVPLMSFLLSKYWVFGSEG